MSDILFCDSDEGQNNSSSDTNNTEGDAGDDRDTASQNVRLRATAAIPICLSGPRMPHTETELINETVSRFE